jgi:hypothetical protein
MEKIISVEQMVKELLSVQPIHKDEKVVEAFNFLLNNKEWSIPCSCRIDNPIAVKRKLK